MYHDTITESCLLSTCDRSTLWQSAVVNVRLLLGEPVHLVACAQPAQEDRIQTLKPTDTILDLNAPDTWPTELLAFLGRHHDLLAWETGAGEVRWQDYDAAIYGLCDLLDGYSLVGWHCTRLTQEEVAAIVDDEMQLPDRAMLNRRVDALTRAGVLDEILAGKLKATNQADEDNRAGLIWLCFYPPRVAGESGIKRFFRHWGGEVLYNFHEDEPDTGAAIACIGQPCLIEAAVPISGMESTRTEFNVARRYLIHRGHETAEPVELEGPTKRPLPASAIQRIVAFPSRDFRDLTGCDTWRIPLPSPHPRLSSSG